MSADIHYWSAAVGVFAILGIGVVVNVAAWRYLPRLVAIATILITIILISTALFDASKP